MQAVEHLMVCVCVEGQCYVSEHENQIMMKWKSIIDYKLIAGWNVEIIKALKQSISFTYIHVRRGGGKQESGNFKSFEKCNFFFN
jgi:hypothetical protein